MLAGGLFLLGASAIALRWFTPDGFSIRMLCCCGPKASVPTASPSDAQHTSVHERQKTDRQQLYREAQRPRGHRQDAGQMHGQEEQREVQHRKLRSQDLRRERRKPEKQQKPKRQDRTREQQQQQHQHQHQHQQSPKNLQRQRKTSYGKTPRERVVGPQGSKRGGHSFPYRGRPKIASLDELGV